MSSHYLLDDPRNFIKQQTYYCSVDLHMEPRFSAIINLRLVRF